MGAQMTKELGVYNEEEKVCTPRGYQNVRVLHNDPRSVTSGIKRTPIQVECTPTGIKTEVKDSQLMNLSDKSSFVKNLNNYDSWKSPIEGDITNDSGFKDEKEMDGCIKEETQSISSETGFKSLESDMGRIDASTNQTFPSFPNKHLKPLFQLTDVRSPTLEINRTPVLVECTPELFALHSRIESLSFCDFDVNVDEPSAVISEDDLSSQLNQSSINNWLDTIENKSCATPLNESFAESPRQVAKQQKELNALKKQLFLTPDVRDIPKPKVRTPLGDLQEGQNQLKQSPQKMIRAKQWRNIQDERKRRGLSDENTPPSLPPLSKVSSAPGKIIDRKRNKINWDEENTMFI